MQQIHGSKNNLAQETKYQWFSIWPFQTSGLNNQLVDSELHSLLCIQFKAGKPLSLQTPKGLPWRISLFPLCSMLRFWLLPCQIRDWWIVMVIFVADELFCGIILVLLLLFIICWKLATCFYLEREPLQGKLLYLHVYMNTYMNTPSLLPQILVSLASMFLHEVPLEEWCLNGETGQDGAYGLDQEHVYLLEWVLSCGRNSSDPPPPALQSSPNRSHILCSHGWLHARCGHSAHLQPHAKNNGNPIVCLSQRRCNSPTTLGKQHEEGWEVE